MVKCFRNVNVLLSLTRVAEGVCIPLWLLTWVCSLNLSIEDGFLREQSEDLVSDLCIKVLPTG